MYMEIEVLESTKNKLKFKIKGENHTFCNILREELDNRNIINIFSKLSI